MYYFAVDLILHFDLESDLGSEKFDDHCCIHNFVTLTLINLIKHISVGLMDTHTQVRWWPGVLVSGRRDKLNHTQAGLLLARTLRGEGGSPNRMEGCWLPAPTKFTSRKSLKHSKDKLQLVIIYHPFSFRHPNINSYINLILNEGHLRISFYWSQIDNKCNSPMKDIQSQCGFLTLVCNHSLLLVEIINSDCSHISTVKSKRVRFTVVSYF